MIAGLAPATVVVLVLAALVVGFSKTAVAGLGPVATVLFTLVMSAHDATGAVLVLLIACDLVAVVAYRRSCDWRLIRVLMPSLVVGIMLGAWCLTLLDDVALRRTIGALLLAMGLMQLAQEVQSQRGRGATDEQPADVGQESQAPGRAVGLLAGSAAGFTTMTANAAGPVMAIYLLHLRVPKLLFVGTSAWFYCLANLVKLPFAIGIGLVHPGSLWLNLALVVPALVGCALGLKVLPHIPQRVFDRLALALAIGSSLLLLLR
ncbi:sulfite exporter TauE/SafE family protein [Luteococcus peritonei]|uniref:Probable membrane transporter protein n=1 Tax=Luteococcus peritonei TaxID=88874 RepID=A0ABW4RS27_9ACTN